MNKTDKIIVIFYIVLAVSYGSAIIYLDNSIRPVQTREEIQESVNKIEFVNFLNANKSALFNTIANVQNYPIILPQNVISIKIVNQTNDIIYAEEELIEKFLKTKLLVKHTIQPYDKQILEVMNGDAKGTKIVLTFEETDSSTTQLTTEADLHLRGVLKFIGFLPKTVLEKALNPPLESFAIYARGFDDETKKIIDDLYREILYRPVDKLGLEYYGLMLESGKMTKDDLRKALLESPEKKMLLEPHERKTVAELKDETKKIIDDLYREILYRPADELGLAYFGSMLESGKMTKDDLRKALLESEEKRMLTP